MLYSSHTLLNVNIKNIMKKCTNMPLPVMAVGLLFAVAGLLKLFIMTPAGFAGMLEMALGFGSGLALFSAWLVAIFETLGGLAILFSKKLKCKKTYKALVSILILIMVVAIVSVDLLGESFDIIGLLKNLVVLAVLVKLALCCKMGRCGAGDDKYKTEDSTSKLCTSCEAGTCTLEEHKG